MDPDGSSYHGPWVEGNRHGFGRKLTSSGSWKQGLWETGQQVGELEEVTMQPIHRIFPIDRVIRHAQVAWVWSILAGVLSMPFVDCLGSTSWVTVVFAALGVAWCLHYERATLDQLGGGTYRSVHGFQGKDHTVAEF